MRFKMTGTRVALPSIMSMKQKAVGLLVSVLRKLIDRVPTPEFDASGILEGAFVELAGRRNHRGIDDHVL